MHRPVHIAYSAVFLSGLSLTLLVSETAAAPSLADAIAVFNARAAHDPIGKTQPPLTEDEVVAVIRWTVLDRSKLEVSDATFQQLRDIPRTRQLPPGFEFEHLSGYKPNDEVSFRVWSVRLRVPSAHEGRTTCVMIREQMIGSQLVGEEAAKPEVKKSEGNVTLMGMLSEWMYPGAQMPTGASASDGGNPLVQSIKCQAVLTTPDPIDKVIAFYAEKIGPMERPDVSDLKLVDAKSVTSQNDSKDRPVTVRVFSVNKLDRTITLVISRAQDEKETHIAWSLYRRFD